MSVLISSTTCSSSSSVSWLSSSFCDNPFKQFVMLSALDSHRFTLPRALPTLSLYSSKSLFNFLRMKFFNMQFILHLTFFYTKSFFVHTSTISCSLRSMTHFYVSFRCGLMLTALFNTSMSCLS